MWRRLSIICKGCSQSKVTHACTPVRMHLVFVKPLLTATLQPYVTRTIFPFCYGNATSLHSFQKKFLQRRTITGLGVYPSTDNLHKCVRRSFVVYNVCGKGLRNYRTELYWSTPLFHLGNVGIPSLMRLRCFFAQIEHLW